ncbi:MAG: hypothetical protein M1822_007073 [Bathelium mastoideum]|nr:MAG: hypothetical protein M1822_007073 [Bathelium mastoideum]
MTTVIHANVLWRPEAHPQPEPELERELHPSVLGPTQRKRPFRITLKLAELPFQHGGKNPIHMWRPMYQEMPRQNEPAYLRPLDVCDVWKGLSYAHAKELAFWERAFHMGIQECLGNFVLGKFRGDPEWTSAMQLGEFVNRELARTAVFVDVNDLASKMLRNSSHQKFTKGLLLQAGHGDPRSAVKLFLATRQCWQNKDQPMITVDFSAAWTSKHLEILTHVMWQPPVISLAEPDHTPTYVEPDLGQWTCCSQANGKYEFSANQYPYSWPRIHKITLTISFTSGVVFQRVMRTQVNLRNVDDAHLKPKPVTANPDNNHHHVCLSSGEDYADYPTSDEEFPGRVPSSLEPCPSDHLHSSPRLHVVGQSHGSSEQSSARRDSGFQGAAVDHGKVPTAVHIDEPAEGEGVKILTDNRVDSPVGNLGPEVHDAVDNRDLLQCSEVASAAVHLTMRAARELRMALQLQDQILTDLKSNPPGSRIPSSKDGIDSKAESRKIPRDHDADSQDKSGDSPTVCQLRTPSNKTKLGASAAQNTDRGTPTSADLEQARIRDNYDQFRTAQGVRNRLYGDLAELFEFSQFSQDSPSEGSSNGETGKMNELCLNEHDQSEDETLDNTDVQGRHDTLISIKEDEQTSTENACPPLQELQSPLPKPAVLGENQQMHESAKPQTTPKLGRVLPLSAYESQQRPQFPQLPEIPQLLPVRELPREWLQLEPESPQPTMENGCEKLEIMSPHGCEKPWALPKLTRQTLRDTISLGDVIDNLPSVPYIRGGCNSSPTQTRDCLTGDHLAVTSPHRILPRQQPHVNYYTLQPAHYRGRKRVRTPSFTDLPSHENLSGLARIEGMLDRLEGPSYENSRQSLQSNTRPKLSSRLPCSSLARDDQAFDLSHRFEERPVKMDEGQEPHNQSKESNSSPCQSPTNGQTSHLVNANSFVSPSQEAPSTPPTPPPHRQDLLALDTVPRPNRQSKSSSGQSEIADGHKDSSQANSTLLIGRRNSWPTAEIECHELPDEPENQDDEAELPVLCNTGNNDNANDVIGLEKIDEVEESSSPGPSPSHWKGKAASFAELLRWFSKARAVEEARCRRRGKSVTCSEHDGCKTASYEAGPVEGKENGGRYPDGKEERQEVRCSVRRGVLLDRGNGTEMDGSGCLGTDDFWSND